MTASWPAPKGPLDWVAEHTAEAKWEASGSPRPKKEDASEWLEEPRRSVLIQATFQAQLDATTLSRKELSVIVGNRGYILPLAQDGVDADYADGPDSGNQKGRSHTLRNDAKHFDLKRRGVSLGDGEIDTLLESCRVELDVKYSPPGRITLDTLTLRPLVRPRFAPCLPLPSEPNKFEWRCTKSPAAWQTMLSLAKVFGGARAPIALVTGPPGSGKEAYGRAVHFGQSKNLAAGSTSLVTLSLAEIGTKDLKERLGGGLLEKLEQLQGTLFLDEVDKATPEVRSFLLRILESRRYENRHGDTKDCDHVAFVVAAGKPLGALRGAQPPDFWTRMETHIPVGDPLTAGSQSQREELLDAFFKFFWWDAVSDWLAGRLSRDHVKDWEDFFQTHQEASRLAEGIFGVSVGDMDGGNFKASKPIENVAAHFASVLSPHLERRQLSLRGLRSAVGAVQRAVRSQLIAMALASGDPVKKRRARAAFNQIGELAVQNAIGTVLQVLPDENDARNRPRR